MKPNIIADNNLISVAYGYPNPLLTFYITPSHLGGWEVSLTYPPTPGKTSHFPTLSSAMSSINQRARTLLEEIRNV